MNLSANNIILPLSEAPAMVAVASRLSNVKGKTVTWKNRKREARKVLFQSFESYARVSERETLPTDRPTGRMRPSRQSDID